MTEDQRFGLHDMKRRGATDATGTKAEKQQKTGHKSARMVDAYDLSIAKVKPAGE